MIKKGVKKKKSSFLTAAQIAEEISSSRVHIKSPDKKLLSKAALVKPVKNRSFEGSRQDVVVETKINQVSSPETVVETKKIVTVTEEKKSPAIEPVIDNTVVQANNTFPSNKEGGIIEMLGGLTMILILIEIIVIVGVFLAVLFLK
ncbi:MAG: hypothetical protein NTY48_03400 [Candidatus Diapherotrites archaeon]|nr:hypothetical protein [Candidatus Diapherotrites archaeon]